MAELETTSPAVSCCAPEAQASCCEPEAKADGCGEPHVEGRGCAAEATATTDLGRVRETVRARYAAAAQTVAAGAGCGCGPSAGLVDEHGTQVFGAGLYGDEELDRGTAAAVGASLGC